MVRRSGRVPASVALAIGVAVCGTLLAACAVPLSSSGNPARRGSGTTRSGSSDFVIVCDSGTSSSGGVDTSSSVAVRVPVGTPVPPGCREG